jgi:uncharacterized membrane protein
VFLFQVPDLRVHVPRTHVDQGGEGRSTHRVMTLMMMMMMMMMMLLLLLLLLLMMMMMMVKNTMQTPMSKLTMTTTSRFVPSDTKILL